MNTRAYLKTALGLTFSILASCPFRKPRLPLFASRLLKIRTSRRPVAQCGGPSKTRNAGDVPASGTAKVMRTQLPPFRDFQVPTRKRSLACGRLARH
jgi:hypothetical protein